MNAESFSGKSAYEPQATVNPRIAPGYFGPPSPYSNTGGNFSSRTNKTEKTALARVCIDYLTLSFPDSAFVNRDADTIQKLQEGKLLITPAACWLDYVGAHLSTWMNLDCIEVMQQGKGFNGFQESATISILTNDGERQQVGIVAWGGASQRGRMAISLTGMGTALIEDWQSVYEYTEITGGRISRIDLAADFLAGEYTVDQAIRQYQQGDFKPEKGGGNPKARLIDDMGCNTGRTFYIGKRENGKMLRIYEKGKQLGDKNSAWVRAEGEIHDKDRIIPLETMIQPEKFWAGLTPVFASLISVAAERIRTGRKLVQVTIDKLVHHCRESYGKLLNLLLGQMDGDAEKVMQALIKEGVPRRLRPVRAVHSLDTLPNALG